MDEAYMGGRGYGGKYNVNQSQNIKAKTVVIGAVERGGDIKVETSPNPTTLSLKQFLNNNIDTD